jgi:hypothetical protein
VNLLNSKNSVQGVQDDVQGTVQGKTVAAQWMFKVFKVKSIFFRM